MNYEEWKKKLDNLVSGNSLNIEKIPSVVKRCPKCSALSLEFDAKTGRIFCTKCGFEEWFKVM